MIGRRGAGPEGRSQIARIILGGHDVAIHVLAFLGAALVLAMSFWTAYEIVVRYVFLSPTSWASDLSEYSMVAITFLAAPWVLRKGAHVKVDLVIAKLADTVRQALFRITSLLSFAVCIAFAYYAGDTTLGYFLRNLYFAKSWAIPQWIPYAPIALGFFFLAAEFLFQGLGLVSVESEDKKLMPH
jgi:TRAP-type C4-dicarboxylate transport system permease small subunit